MWLLFVLTWIQVALLFCALKVIINYEYVIFINVIVEIDCAFFENFIIIFKAIRQFLHVSAFIKAVRIAVIFQNMVVNGANYIHYGLIYKEIKKEF